MSSGEEKANDNNAALCAGLRHSVFLPRQDGQGLQSDQVPSLRDSTVKVNLQTTKLLNCITLTFNIFGPT